MRPTVWRARAPWSASWRPDLVGPGRAVELYKGHGDHAPVLAAYLHLGLPADRREALATMDENPELAHGGVVEAALAAGWVWDEWHIRQPVHPWTREVDG